VAQILYKKIIITLGKQWIPAQLLVKNVLFHEVVVNFFSKKNKHHHISMIDGFGNSQQDSETKIKFAMFGQDHLNKSKRQVGVQPTDIAFQMSFSHTGCPTSTDASDFGRGNTWHLNDGGIELDDERKSIFDKYVESGGSKRGSYQSPICCAQRPCPPTIDWTVGMGGWLGACEVISVAQRPCAHQLITCD